MTDIITPTIVQKHVDAIFALPVAEQADAITSLNHWLVEALKRDQVERPRASARIALEASRDRGTLISGLCQHDIR